MLVADDKSKSPPECDLRFLNDLVEHAPQALAISDMEGHLVRWNRAFEELIGFSADELRRMTYQQLTPERWHRFEAAQLSKLRKTGKPAFYEKELLRRDGALVDVELKAGIYRDVDSSSTFLYAFIDDVTGRRRVEQMLQNRAWRQALLAEIGLKALTGIELNRLFDEACGALLQTLSVELAQVLELSADGQALLLCAGRGWKAGTVGAVRVSTRDSYQVAYTLRTREPIVVRDIAAEKRFTAAPHLAAHGGRSGISVAISGKTAAWGVLAVHSTAVRAFSQEDVDFVQATANVLAAAIAGGAAERQIHQQQLTLRELSTPVLEVREQLLILPLIGAMTPARARQMTDELLAAIRHFRARVVVIDVTGVPDVDQTVANHLIHTVEAARLLGARVVLSGISRPMSQALVNVAVNLDTLVTVGDLRSGIDYASRLL